MKKITLYFVAIIISLSLSAQQAIQGSASIKKYGAIPVTNKKIKVNTEVQSSKNVGDTIGLTNTSDYFPTIVLADLVGGYGMTSGGNHIGYWWGTNGSPTDTASDVWIQVYENNGTTPLLIDGIGFYCVNKYRNPTAGIHDTVYLTVNKLFSDGCGIAYESSTQTWTNGPGPKAYLTVGGTNGSLMGKTYIRVANIDTSLSSGLVFNYRAFTTPVLVSGSSPPGLAVCANFHQPRVYGDTAYLVCDGNGDGYQFCYSQSGSIPGNFIGTYYLPTSNYFTYNGTPGGLDNNGALFAIVGTGVGINDDFFQGMKLELRNTQSQSYLYYAIERDCKVTLNIHDITGKLIESINPGSQAAGLYSIELNNDRFTPGQYIIVMTAGSGKMAKKVFIK
jgi:hypothetical protein